MQTFLPLPDFAASAKCLDYRRLGKQRVEALQIYNTLLAVGEAKGWRNHPAVLMWKGHTVALCIYGEAMCTEWIMRGYQDTILHHFQGYILRADTFTLPPWLGQREFHASHRAALLAKDPAHYSQFGWSEEPAIDYWWPIKEMV